MTTRPVESARPKVVIIGAGFGGLAAARGLAGAPVEVTLVDRNNFHTFLPLLYQVATAGLNAADVAHAVRGIVRGIPNVAFRQGTVADVDWTAKLVRLATDSANPAAQRTKPDQCSGALPFDYLVVAAGASAEYFDIPGAAEHARPLYTLDDAAALRNHVLSRFEATDADPLLAEDGALTFAVVGGGPTGVEVAGALAELFSVVLRRDFPRIDIDKARIVLIEMGDHLLPAFGHRSRTGARRTLEARGVEVRTGEAVAEVTPTRVRLRSGAELAAHTLVWAAGVRANPVAEALGVETARGGRVLVGPDLRVPAHPEAFAIGDIAAIRAAPAPDKSSATGGFLPGVAQVAIQSGRYVAAQVSADATDPASRPASGSRAPFRYTDKGSMATIGRRAAVADIPLPGPGDRTVRLSGTPGWLAWLGLHLVYLIGFRNRASVLLNWAWNYVTWDRGTRLIFGSSRRPSQGSP